MLKLWKQYRNVLWNKADVYTCKRIYKYNALNWSIDVRTANVEMLTW